MLDHPIFTTRDLWIASYLHSQGFLPERCFALDGQPTVVFEFGFTTALLEKVNEYTGGLAHPEVGAFNRSRVAMRKLIDQALGRGRAKGGRS